MKELPNFKPRRYEHVKSLMERIFTNERVSEETQFVDLIEYDDGHYRALFNPAYFVLVEGTIEPSKSQWNTLKKHAKRFDEKLFIFKEHGETKCSDAACYYLDFGFFAD